MVEAPTRGRPLRPRLTASATRRRAPRSRADPDRYAFRSPPEGPTSVRHHRSPARPRRPARPAPRLRSSTGSSAVQAPSLAGPDAIDAARDAAAVLEELDDAPPHPRRCRACSCATRAVATRTGAVGRRRRRLGGHGRGTARRGRRASSAHRSRTSTPRCSASRTRCGPSSATGSAPPQVRELAGDRPSWSAIEVGTSIQLALSALDRLEVRGRDSAGLTSSCATTASTSPIRRSPALVAARSGDPLFRPAPCARRGAPQLRLQGGRRDRRAGRQHRRPARRPPRRRPPAPGPGRRPRAAAAVLGPHPLGQRRHHLPGQRPPAQQRRGSTDPIGPYVTAALNGDVDNYADLKAADGLRLAAEITTDAKVIPTLVSRRLAEGADLAEAFRDTVAALRGLGGHRRQRRRPTPTACCSPCGAAARPSTSGWPRTATSWPPSPTAWSRTRAPTCAWTARRRPTPRTPTPAAARSSCSTARRPARSTGIDRLAYDGTDLPVERGRPPARADHHPRHRPRRRTRTSCSRRSARRPTVPQDAAGQARRRGDGALHVRARRGRAAGRRPRAAAQRSHRPRPGHRAGHRARRRPEPRQRPRRQPSPTAACGSRPCRPPSCRASACAPT